MGKKFEVNGRDLKKFPTEGLITRQCGFLSAGTNGEGILKILIKSC